MNPLAWLNPARWLAVAALCAGLLAGYTFWARHQRETGRNEVRAEWTADKLAASEASRQREKALTIAAQGVDRAYQIEKNRRAAVDRITAERLREFEAALAGASSVDAAPLGGADDPRGQIAGECAGQLQALDIHAGKLAGQARGLQAYARDVCLTSSP